MSSKTSAILGIGALLGLTASGLGAQSPSAHGACFITPLSRPFDAGAAAQVTEVTADVAILERIATTTLEVHLRNPTGARIEGQLILPVPADATVKSFSFQGASAGAGAVLLSKEEARRLYESIVSKARDPAILEFLGYGSIRSSVFPIEAGGEQRVRLAYEHLLPVDGERVDYVLLRSESLEVDVPWKISVKIESPTPISTVYSPTHPVQTVRPGPSAATVHLSNAGARAPGSFQLSYLREARAGISASLFAYPEPKSDGGYFLLLAGLPAKAGSEPAAPAIQREITLVLDRSGSMRGEKLEQAREAALQVLAGIEDGEAFNILAYDDAVGLFSPAPVVKDRDSAARARAYLRGITAGSGTNIHAALLEALRQAPAEGRLPIVLFLTDGLATVGETSEAAIRAAAAKANPHGRRVFTFGIGVDVNTHLLEKIASDTRGAAAFVLPDEPVERKVSQTFARLSGPVLADPIIEAGGPPGSPAGSRTEDLLPAKLPDLFEGDQIVLLGRYRGSEPLHFLLTGNCRGEKRSFRLPFEIRPTERNSFVPRLWASRKIGVLVDAIRALGAGGAPGAPPPAQDPRLRELVGEIVRLSTEFGVLTEYTAFIATEGTDLTRREAICERATSLLVSRAVETRSGWGSLNQSLNNSAQMAQGCLNRRNDYLSESMDRVESSGVQQVADLSFFRKGKAWIDSRALLDGKAEPKMVVEFGTREYWDVILRLAGSNRQGCLTLRGDVIVVVDGTTVLLKAGRT